MLGSILASAAKTAARNAMAQKKARDEALRRAGYRCPACQTDQVPEMIATPEKLTLGSFFFRGGLMGMLWRRMTTGALRCPKCNLRPNLTKWLGPTGNA